MTDSKLKFRRLYLPRRGAAVYFSVERGQKPLIFVKGYKPFRGGILDFNGKEFVPPDSVLEGSIRFSTLELSGSLVLPPKSVHELEGVVEFAGLNTSGSVDFTRLYKLRGDLQLPTLGLSGAVTIEAPFSVEGALALPTIQTVQGEFSYDPDLFRGVTGSLTVPYTKAVTKLNTSRALFSGATKLKGFFIVGFSPSAKFGADVDSPYSVTDKTRTTRQVWGVQAIPLRSEDLEAKYSEAVRIRSKVEVVSNYALSVIRLNVKDGYSDMIRKRRALAYSFNRADKLGHDHEFKYNGLTLRMHRMYRVTWGMADKIRVGKFRKPNHPLPAPPTIKPSKDNQINFCKPYNPSRKMRKNILYFGLLRCKRPMEIGDGDFYVMLNEVTVTLLNTGEELNPTQASIDTDGASWCAAMSMVLKEEDVSKLRAVKESVVQIGITVGGDSFVFMFESATRSRTFGSDSFTIKGRNVTALLDAPHCDTINYTNTVETSAYEIVRQIVFQAVGDGLEAQWEDLIDLASWTVPAYAFSTVGKTPIQAIKDLIEPVGGIVVSHPSLPRIVIRKAYRKPFWNLEDSEHDYVLPESLMVSEGVSDDPLVAKNAVFVVDSKTGDYSKVYRLGTAGNALSTTLTSDLYSSDQIRREAGVKTLIESNPSTEYSYSFFKPSEVHHIQPYDRLGVVGESSEHWGYLNKVSLGISVSQDVTHVVYSVSMKTYTGVQPRE